MGRCSGRCLVGAGEGGTLRPREGGKAGEGATSPSPSRDSGEAGSGKREAGDSGAVGEGAPVTGLGHSGRGRDVSGLG